MYQQAELCGHMHTHTGPNAGFCDTHRSLSARLTEVDRQLSKQQLVAANAKLLAQLPDKGQKIRNTIAALQVG